MNLASIALALAGAFGPGPDPDKPVFTLYDDSPPPFAEPIPPPPAQDTGPMGGWWIGGHLGYAEGFDADEGGFIIGGQGRVGLLPWLGAELSIDLHNEEYESGDIEVLQIAHQVSVLFYPTGEWKIRPYGLAGLGLYYTRTDFSGSLSSRDDDTDFSLGFHLGGGAMLALQPNILLRADLRFAFVEEPNRTEGNEFDYWQLWFGVDFLLSR